MKDSVDRSDQVCLGVVCIHTHRERSFAIRLTCYRPSPHVRNGVGWLSDARNVVIIKCLRGSAVRSVDDENVNAFFRFPRVILGRSDRGSGRGGLEWFSWGTILVVLMERK